MVAAFGDFQIGVVPRRQLHALRGNQIQKRLVLRRQVFVHRGHHFLVALRPRDLQHLRMAIEDLLRLRAEAAGHDHLAVLGERLADRLQRFVDRGIDEAAGVHDDQVRRAIARRDFIAFGAQPREDALRVDQRLGTAEADEAHFRGLASGGFQERSGDWGSWRGDKKPPFYKKPVPRRLLRSSALSNAGIAKRDAVLRNSPKKRAAAPSRSAGQSDKPFECGHRSARLAGEVSTRDLGPETGR